MPDDRANRKAGMADWKAQRSLRRDSGRSRSGNIFFDHEINVGIWRTVASGAWQALMLRL